MRVITIATPGHRDDKYPPFEWRVMTGRLHGLQFNPDHMDDYGVTFQKEAQVEKAIEIAKYLEAASEELRATKP